MPSTRAVAAIAAGLVALGLVGLVVGGVLLISSTGAISWSGMVALIGGLVAVLGGYSLLTRGRVGQTRAKTTVPGIATVRESTSMLPGGTLVFVGLVLGAVGIRGATWLFVPAAITGLIGIVLFARSGSPDEPA